MNKVSKASRFLKLIYSKSSIFFKPMLYDKTEVTS